MAPGGYAIPYGGGGAPPGGGWPYHGPCCGSAGGTSGKTPKMLPAPPVVGSSPPPAPLAPTGRTGTRLAGLSSRLTPSSTAFTGGGSKPSARPVGAAPPSGRYGTDEDGADTKPPPLLLSGFLSTAIEPTRLGAPDCVVGANRWLLPLTLRIATEPLEPKLLPLDENSPLCDELPSLPERNDGSVSVMGA